ncbi:hypothetical protein J2S74_003640 [Evansella vedderi]|uniref:Uncharacterized protein n=1 Tax=Evansella vedderi TaxID=38282 RepID=A0ABT9ZYC1_9BACI|nr:hypothetical protein [Evansella vedderi]
MAVFVNFVDFLKGWRSGDRPPVADPSNPLENSLLYL